ncbi:DNA-binding NarL/FixJ family response regulator [Catenulispora sp. MAP5-51]|uniref:response regulator n=1 Tax=Catenulispora sp. MAP5-51 TaxID=3156298 RepID=UPI0035198629
MAVRILLADDQPLIRSALVMAATDRPDLDVVGEAGTGLEAVRMTRTLRPDVVVMDIRMPGMDGIEATGLITAGPDTARVMVRTTFDDDDNVYNALRAGASGFLVKDMGIAEILAGVQVIAAGDALIAPKVTRRLIEQFARRTRTEPPPADRGRHLGVTGRELETLALIARGLTNAEIAEAMGISGSTVKSYVTRLLVKLDARDRVQLVIVAYENGLVSTGDSPYRSIADNRSVPSAVSADASSE